MDVLLNVGLFVGSLFVLIKASDWFIDSAENIGLSFGISPFIVGVTIVAFGTSLPELATSVAAVLSGNSEIVAGNVVGSNITNIALVLGLVAFVAKTIKLDTNIWHKDMPYLWGSAFLLWFAARDGVISMIEAFIFIACLVIFLIYSFKENKEKEDINLHPKSSVKDWLMLVIGAGLVSVSAAYTIQAITELSSIVGIDPEVIALSAVALGTSLPEVIVSLNAVKKGKTSIAVGNVLGSNIFNTFIVMSIPRFFGEINVSADILEFSLPFMIVMTILFGVISNDKKITRWEGALLLVFYLFFFIELFKN